MCVGQRWSMGFCSFVEIGDNLIAPPLRCIQIVCWNHHCEKLRMITQRHTHNRIDNIHNLTSSGCEQHATNMQSNSCVRNEWTIDALERYHTPATRNRWARAHKKSHPLRSGGNFVCGHMMRTKGSRMLYNNGCFMFFFFSRVVNRIHILKYTL